MSTETKSTLPTFQVTNDRPSGDRGLEHGRRKDSGSSGAGASYRVRAWIRGLRWGGKFCARPTLILAVLLIMHLCSRLALHRTSPLSGTHNYDRAYGVSLSLLAGRGFKDIVIDDSPASAPLQEFFDLKRSRLSREELATYLASKPDSARDPYFGRFLSLATIRVADVRLAAILWRIFGVDRGVLASCYCLFSMATCGGLFLIARRLTGSGWAGLAAAGLFSISPIEGFLNTWSWRDASPMWFSAASLACFTCRLERSRRPAVNYCAYLVLGILAAVGMGWRIDALLLVPFLAAGVVIKLIAARAGWRHLFAAVSCFVVGVCGVRMSIAALGSEQSQTANVGFHMAFYGDFPRSKLLGIENSFQVLFSDMQTLDNARQIHQAQHPDEEPLRYLSKEYCDVCRGMFFEELSYNLFHWINRFPRFYFQALRGLDSQSMIGELGSRQISLGLSPPLRQYLSLGDQLAHLMPFLFLAGVLATTCAGPQRLPALLVALFSVYYAGVMFLVLPDQKHLGILLVPLYMFAGAGIWGITRLIACSSWNGNNLVEWGKQIRRVGIVAFISAAAWGMACVWAHGHSVGRRQELLSEIQKRVAVGIDAPETLRGERNFAVSIRPDSSADAAGYLLTIKAGEHPGVLTCRQVYFPRDWAHLWGRELITRHSLVPNRQQSFFVSCLQGSRLGDPCPHTCSVAIDGEARILRSTRVAMNDWDHPQICTLFYDGQQSPGSPRINLSSTDWLYVACRPFSDPSPDKVQANRNGMSDIMAPVPAPSSSGRPLRHLIAHSAETGLWKIAMSDGWRFSFADLNYWSPTANWQQLHSGDFNGDGMFDLVGQALDGQWWLALANGGYHEFRAIDSVPKDPRYDFVGVGDFNGDGLDDLILRSTDGRWTLAVSTGDGFHCQPIDGLPSGTLPKNIRVGDFLGNGRKQIVGLNSPSGVWTIASLDGTQWTARPWGAFPANIDWHHLTVGDFCGTGYDDVAAWDPATGSWTVGRNDGAALVAKPFGNWPTGKTWKCVQSGQFGDGFHAGLAAIDGNSGELNVAVSDGKQFTTRQFAGHAALADRFYVGSFSGGPHDELLGIATDDQLWVGKLNKNGELSYESWGRWPKSRELKDFCSVGFWPERGPNR